VPADFAISDEPAALLDLARRWGVPKKRVWYAAESRGIAPTYVVANVGIYDALAQEEIARAMDETSSKIHPRRQSP
jgi:hypothetical protein